jgi:hypothetical protein
MKKLALIASLLCSAPALAQGVAQGCDVQGNCFPLLTDDGGSLIVSGSSGGGSGSSGGSVAVTNFPAVQAVAIIFNDGGSGGGSGTSYILGGDGGLLVANVPGSHLSTTVDNIPAVFVIGSDAGFGSGGTSWDAGVIIQYPIPIASLWDGGVVVQNFPVSFGVYIVGDGGTVAVNLVGPNVGSVTQPFYVEPGSVSVWTVEPLNLQIPFQQFIVGSDGGTMVYNEPGTVLAVAIVGGDAGAAPSGPQQVYWDGGGQGFPIVYNGGGEDFPVIVTTEVNTAVQAVYPGVVMPVYILGTDAGSSSGTYISQDGGVLSVNIVGGSAGGGGGTTFILGGDGGVPVTQGGPLIALTVSDAGGYVNNSDGFICCGTTATQISCPAGSTALSLFNAGPNPVEYGASTIATNRGITIEPTQTLQDNPSSAAGIYCVSTALQTDGGCTQYYCSGP